MVSKKTIVLLHGFGEDHRIFDRQAKVLAEKYRVIVPDLPGSGTLNDHQWQPGSETIEWLADWVKTLLDENGISDCILLGHSMGGYIALAFAEKYPGNLQAFGLVHSSAFADADAKKETRKKAIAFMEEKGAHTFLKTAIPGLFSSSFASSYPGVIEALIEDARTFKTASLAAYYRAMISRPDRTQVLKNATVPVLMVAGTEDIAVPLPDLLKQAPLPSNCHFHILQNSGHMGMLEEPENLSKILLNFANAIY